MTSQQDRDKGHTGKPDDKNRPEQGQWPGTADDGKTTPGTGYGQGGQVPQDEPTYTPGGQSGNMPHDDKDQWKNPQGSREGAQNR